MLNPSKPGKDTPEANRSPKPDPAVAEQAALDQQAQAAGAPSMKEQAASSGAGGAEAQRAKADKAHKEAGHGAPPKLGDLVYWAPPGSQGKKELLKPAFVIQRPGEEQPDQHRVTLEVLGQTEGRIQGATEGNEEGQYRRSAE